MMMMVHRVNACEYDYKPGGKDVYEERCLHNRELCNIYINLIKLIQVLGNLLYIYVENCVRLRDLFIGISGSLF